MLEMAALVQVVSSLVSTWQLVLGLKQTASPTEIGMDANTNGRAYISGLDCIGRSNSTALVSSRVCGAVSSDAVQERHEP
jgi:hypothetical protein